MYGVHRWIALSIRVSHKGSEPLVYKVKYNFWFFYYLFFFFLIRLKMVDALLVASSLPHLDSMLTLKWWELLYTWAGWIYHHHPPGGDQDVVYLYRPITDKTPCMFQQICEHLGQMSNIGFSTQICGRVNDHNSLSEVFTPPDWQLCVNRWKWQGGCKALAWNVDLGAVYINALRKFHPLFGCDCMTWLCRRCGNGISLWKK